MSEKLIDVTQPHTIDVEFDYANPPEGGWTPETVISHLVRSGVPLFSVSDEQIESHCGSASARTTIRR